VEDGFLDQNGEFYEIVDWEDLKETLSKEPSAASKYLASSSTT